MAEKIKIKNLEALTSFLDEKKKKESSNDTKAKKLFVSPEEDMDYDVGKSDNKSGRGMGWYVVHTYSGYENQVKKSIEKTIENQKNDENNKHLEEKILEVRIPMQDVVEVKAAGKKNSQKKIFPGYVLIHMDPDDNDAWYVVRNTRGVTGFVGPGSKPVPLNEMEVAELEKEEIQKADFEVGETILVVAGAWKDTIGQVTRIDDNKRTATIMVEMFGRETPVEISFSDVKKMD